MEFLNDCVYSYKKDARAKYLLQRNGCNAVLAVQFHLVEFLDRSRLVRLVAVFEDVHLLFLEKDVSISSETPPGAAVLDEGTDSVGTEEVNPRRSSHVADSNVGEDVMDWLSSPARLEEE
jgi:hypothetical protein